MLFVHIDHPAPASLKCVVHDVSRTFRTLGIGLIGLGRHGSRYAKHILADLPDARLVAVSRRRQVRGMGSHAALAVALLLRLSRVDC